MNENGSFREWAAENQGRLLIGLVVIVALIAGATGWIVGRTHGGLSGTGGATRSAIVDEFADESEGASASMPPTYTPPPAALVSPTVSPESYRRVDTAEAYDERTGRTVPGANATVGTAQWPAPTLDAATPPQSAGADAAPPPDSGQAVVDSYPLLRPAEAGPSMGTVPANPSRSGGGSSSPMHSTQHFGAVPTPPPLMGTITVRPAQGGKPKADPGARVVVYSADGAWSEDKRLNTIGSLDELMEGREPFREVKADENGQFWVADLAPGEYIVAFESGRSAESGDQESDHFCHAERVTIVRGQPLTLSFEFDASRREQA